jgi:hypothetical protein
LVRIRVDRRILFALAAGAVVGALIQGLHLRSAQTESMRRANIVNTVFYAMLPQSNDRIALSRALRLPEPCSAHSGSSWFTHGMAEGTLCPEALTLSRVDLARGLVSEPSLLPRVLWEGARRSRPWIPPHLGVVEHCRSESLPATHPSLDRLLQRLPEPAYLALLLLLPVLALGLARLRREPEAAGHAALILCSILPWPCLAVVVLGDGYADTAKQSHLGTAFFVSAVVLSAMFAAAGVWRHLYRSRLAARARGSLAR